MAKLRCENCGRVWLPGQVPPSDTNPPWCPACRGVLRAEGPMPGPADDPAPVPEGHFECARLTPRGEGDFVKARLGGVEISLDARGMGQVSFNGHAVFVRGVTLKSHAGKPWEVSFDVLPVKLPGPREA